ncbi:hypothetical protein M0804_006226 [Polistes exclamans]|nr:hypothetical protein M0804_006226 [Polistes exclamans]
MNHPPEGIFCFRKEGTDDGIIVTIVGPPGCSYEADVLELDLDLPPRYPFHPPHVQFRTPVYHLMDIINNRLSFEIKARRLHDGKRKRSQTPSIY